MILTAEHQGQTFPADLSRVTGLDALVYRQAVGEDLEARVLAVAGAPPEAWTLADRAVIAWLFVRQNVDPNATLATVAASLTLLPADEPAPAPVAGDVDAPEVT